MERHEEELKEKEDLCSKYKKKLELVMKKNESFQEEIRDYEEMVTNGLIPSAEKGEKNPSRIAEAPKSKRIKIEDEKELKLISMDVDVFPRVRPQTKNQMTSGYT
jgi:hypothetical protein